MTSSKNPNELPDQSEQQFSQEHVRKNGLSPTDESTKTQFNAEYISDGLKVPFHFLTQRKIIMFNQKSNSIITNDAFPLWTPDKGRIFSSDYTFHTRISRTDPEDSWDFPDLQIATMYDGKHIFQVQAEHLAKFLDTHRNCRIILHNAVRELTMIANVVKYQFDIYGQIEKGLIRDTKILHLLYKLATTGNAEKEGSMLWGLVFKYLNTDSMDYWIEDSEVIFLLYQELMRLYDLLREDILRHKPFGFISPEELDKTWERFGPLTHDIQLMGAVALANVTQKGMIVNRTRVEKLRQELLNEQNILLYELRKYDYCPEQESEISLQHILRRIEDKFDIVFEETESGKISTKAKHLKQHEDSVPFINLYLRYRSVSKLLESYCDKTPMEKFYPQVDFLKDAVRTSEFGDISSLNLLRDEQIRGLFFPSDGYYHLDFEYYEIEMAALSQALLSQFVETSAMAEMVNEGVDLHRMLAAKVAKKPLDEVTELERQKAKAANFGLPLGMENSILQDYAKMHFGVKLTVHEVEKLRGAWFVMFPEMDHFLSDISSQTPSKKSATTALTATGRLRSNVGFQSQRSTIFQGLADDGAKLALWKLFRAKCSVISFIDDGFLIEVYKGENIHNAIEHLKYLIIEGMREVLPDVRVDVEQSVKPR